MVTGLILALATAQSANLEVMSTGAMPVIGGYKPQRLQLVAEKPTSLKSAPTFAAPMYGVMEFGKAGSTKKFIVAVDGGKLYVDANANGNLKDDPASEWKAVAYKGSDQKDYVRMAGGFSLVHPQLKKPMHMGAYLFDANDTARAQLKNVLLYYTDYALTGTLAFGASSHKVMFVDWNAKGDFAGEGVQLLIDRDDNNKYDGRFEYYDVTQPFNIGGTTYVLDAKDIGRSKIGLKTSTKFVAEVPAPPNLAVGQNVIAFEADTTDGARVSFPSSYKGKIVMVDFWATWCGPCIAELPNVTKAYDMYHERGFEILGISLDQAEKLDVLNKFCGENKMPWRQVYDGKFWEARIAKMYGIQAIPAVLLVDGDTGEILADASTMRGETIFKTVDAALKKKFGTQ
jgi:thiol-disulfide isomerase/thioredoxin